MGTLSSTTCLGIEPDNKSSVYDDETPPLYEVTEGEARNTFGNENISRLRFGLFSFHYTKNAIPGFALDGIFY